MSYPLRKVVKRESNGNPGWQGGGSWIDTLECGHQVVKKRSAGAPKRRRCYECKDGPKVFPPCERCGNAVSSIKVALCPRCCRVLEAEERKGRPPRDHDHSACVDTPAGWVCQEPAEGVPHG